jgi:hypothetical protein
MRLHYKHQPFKKIIAVCSDNHTKHVHTLWAARHVTADGAYINHSALKSQGPKIYGNGEKERKRSRKKSKPYESEHGIQLTGERGRGVGGMRHSKRILVGNIFTKL